MVGKIRIDQPELNFVDGDDSSQDQTGVGGPWLDILRDLFPFRINQANYNQINYTMTLDDVETMLGKARTATGADLAGGLRANGQPDQPRIGEWQAKAN